MTDNSIKIIAAQYKTNDDINRLAKKLIKLNVKLSEFSRFKYDKMREGQNTTVVDNKMQKFNLKLKDIYSEILKHLINNILSDKIPAKYKFTKKANELVIKLVSDIGIKKIKYFNPSITENYSVWITNICLRECINADRIIQRDIKQKISMIT